MTLVLNGNGLLLEGSHPKIEDKQVPGIHIFKYIYESHAKKTKKCVLLSRR